MKALKMKIVIWGCRGSIATPGKDTLRYGGNSTCLEIRPREGGVIVVDAGSGIRLLGKKLIKDQTIDRINMILTHAHWDHLSGFAFFLPVYFDRYTINVHGGPKALRSLRKYFSEQMDAPYFPIAFELLNANFKFGHECPERGTIGSIKYIPIHLNHPNGGYGFKFVENDKTFVFLTDNELGYEHPGGLTRDKYLEFCKGADLMIHDAQYTDEEYKITRGWGHSTYRDATLLALEAGVKKFCFFHHDPDRTDDDLDRQLEYCKNLISKTDAQIECYAAAEGMEIRL